MCAGGVVPALRAICACVYLEASEGEGGGGGRIAKTNGIGAEVHWTSTVCPGCERQVEGILLTNKCFSCVGTFMRVPKHEPLDATLHTGHV